MIERLQVTLRALAGAPRDDPAAFARLCDDCADALRLALDCMQQELARPQRDALALLNAMLDDPSPDPAAVRVAARDACDSLGIGH